MPIVGDRRNEWITPTIDEFSWKMMINHRCSNDYFDRPPSASISLKFTGEACGNKLVCSWGEGGIPRGRGCCCVIMVVIVVVASVAVVGLVVVIVVVVPIRSRDMYTGSEWSPCKRTLRMSVSNFSSLRPSFVRRIRTMWVCGVYKRLPCL